MENILKYSVDAIREINKKPGIIIEQDDIDDRMLGAPTTPNGKRKDLDNIFAFNQNRDSYLLWSCTAQAATMAVMQHFITDRHDKALWINPAEQWENQLDLGTAILRKGDYVNSAMDICVKHGITLIKGKKTEKVKPKKRKHAQKAEWKKYLDNGQRIVTGSGNHYPMVDTSYFWKPAPPDKRGHCYLIVGYDDSKQAYIAKNSYGNWGLHDSGRFFIKYDDVDEMFRGWVFEF